MSAEPDWTRELPELALAIVVRLHESPVPIAPLGPPIYTQVRRELLKAKRIRAASVPPWPHGRHS